MKKQPKYSRKLSSAPCARSTRLQRVQFAVGGDRIGHLLAYYKPKKSPIIVFARLIEGLFFGLTQIMALGRQNKTTGAAEQHPTILSDESMHCNFGMDLINTIKILRRRVFRIGRDDAGSVSVSTWRRLRDHPRLANEPL